MKVHPAGSLLYKVYSSLTNVLSPLLHLHLRLRRLRGLENPRHYKERLGRASLPRPPGPLLWFHGASLGEGMAAVSVIKLCSRKRPDINILMTTMTLSAIEVIKDRLPTGVICQVAPFDTPSAMDAFLTFWNPSAIMLMENELWPNLIMGASRKHIALGLLNARLSQRSFKCWSRPFLLPLISLMLSKFSLICPLSTIQAIRFQLLQSPPFAINFSGDLKYTVDEFDISDREARSIEELKTGLAHRQVWMASSIHKGEEEVIFGVHKALMQMHPDMVTFIVPRYPRHGQDIALELQKEGFNVALRSRNEKLTPETNVYIVNTLGELRNLYKLSPIAVIGGSFLPGLTGHNISEAAASGCAVLTGHHVGHFSHMITELRQRNPLSVLQVSGKLELEEALGRLFNDKELLAARQMAAKQAFDSLSNGIVSRVLNHLEFHIFRQASI